MKHTNNPEGIHQSSTGGERGFTKMAGFTLLEVLIALLILSIGLLGFAAIQMSALNATEEGYLRSQATAIAESSAARMKANRVYLLQGATNEYNSEAASGTFDLWCDMELMAGPGDLPPMPACAGTDGCLDDQLAQLDKNQICAQMLDSGMPAGRMGVICTDRDGADADNCSTGSRMTILVGWQTQVRDDADNIDDNDTDQIVNNCTESGLGLPSCVTMELIP